MKKPPHAPRTPKAAKKIVFPTAPVPNEPPDEFGNDEFFAADKPEPVATDTLTFPDGTKATINISIQCDNPLVLEQITERIIATVMKLAPVKAVK